MPNLKSRGRLPRRKPRRRKPRAGGSGRLRRSASGAKAAPRISADLVRAGYGGAWKDCHDRAPRFRRRFGLHGYPFDGTVKRISDAEASGEGAAGQGEGQGGGKNQFLHLTGYVAGAMFCSQPFRS